MRVRLKPRHEEAWTKIERWGNVGEVVSEFNYSLFTREKGPWLLISPMGLWVHKYHDMNYEVEIVRESD